MARSFFSCFSSETSSRSISLYAVTTITRLRISCRVILLRIFSFSWATRIALYAPSRSCSALFLSVISYTLMIRPVISPVVLMTGL